MHLHGREGDLQIANIHFKLMTSDMKVGSQKRICTRQVVEYHDICKPEQGMHLHGMQHPLHDILSSCLQVGARGCMCIRQQNVTMFASWKVGSAYAS